MLIARIICTSISDPVPGANFGKVIETALLLREALESLKMPCYAKTTGSKGMHIYIPIQRGPTQKQVWKFAKEFAHAIAAQAPKLITAVYVVAKRPKGRVLVDYNQNAWGRTLASIYSVRPKATATVSAPVTWKELERGVALEDFRIDNVPARVRRLGDLWSRCSRSADDLNLKLIFKLCFNSSTGTGEESEVVLQGSASRQLQESLS